MTAPTRDGSLAQNQNGLNGASSASLNVTTTSTTGVCVVIIPYSVQSGTLPTVTSVTASGLTFTLYKRQQITSGTAKSGIEVWEAPYSAKLTTKTVTVSMSAAADNGSIAACGVTGLHSTSTPHDANAGFPNGQGSTGTLGAFTYTTSQANDLLFAAFCDAVAVSPSAPSGWSSQANFEGTGGCSVSINTRSVTTVQTSQTVTPSVGSPAVGIVWAYTADTPGGNTETGTASMAFGQFTYKRAPLTSTGELAFSGLGILAKAYELGVRGKGLKQFWTK